MSEFLVVCPHCDHDIIIEKINCAIFRHGVIKSTLVQISPHASKEICDNLSENNIIYGCGKPFQIVKNDKDEYVAVKCDYI